MSCKSAADVAQKFGTAAFTVHLLAHTAGEMHGVSRMTNPNDSPVGLLAPWTGGRRASKIHRITSPLRLADLRSTTHTI